MAFREICAVNGKNTVSKAKCSAWYRRFCDGQFDLDDAPRSGRPATTDDNQVLALIRNNPHLTVAEMADTFKISHSTECRRLQKLDMVKTDDVWVPH